MEIFFPLKGMQLLIHLSSTFISLSPKDICGRWTNYRQSTLFWVLYVKLAWKSNCHKCYIFTRHLSIKCQKSYDLFSKGRFAWVVDNKDENKLISTMKKASRLMIIGNSDSGAQTTDHYSMMGFTKAYNIAKKSCG